MKNRLQRFIVLVLAAVLLPSTVFAQGTQYLDGRALARQVREWTKQLDPYIVGDGDGVYIRCADVEEVKKAVSLYGMGNAVVDVTKSRLAGDDVLFVSYYTGSGIIRKEVAVFRAGPAADGYTLMMTARVPEEPGLDSPVRPEYGPAFWRAVYSEEMVAFYKGVQEMME